MPAWTDESSIPCVEVRVYCDPDDAPCFALPWGAPDLARDALDGSACYVTVPICTLAP